MTEIPEHLLKRAAAARERAAARDEQNITNAEFDLSLEKNKENSDLTDYVNEALEKHARLVNNALSYLNEVANNSDTEDEDFWIVDSSKGKDKKNNLSETGQAVADQLITEIGIPECSIAASDYAKDAYEIFGGRLSAVQQGIFDSVVRGKYLDGVPFHKTQGLVEAETGLLDDYRLVNRIASFNTESGFKVKLALSKKVELDKKGKEKKYEQKDLKLVAIVRDKYIFPLVRFQRSESSDASYCDYLQFWGEEEMSELESENFYGWGRDDNGTRFDAVQLVGKILNSKGSRVSAELADSLNLNNRITKILGETDPIQEEIISSIFGEDVTSYKSRGYKLEFPNMKMGKVTTDVTVKGKITHNEDNPDVKNIDIKSFPSSQPDRNWPEKRFIVDKRHGITTFDSDNNTVEPTELDKELLINLLTNGERSIEYLKNTEIKKSRAQKLGSLAISSVGYFTVIESGYLLVGYSAKESIVQSAIGGLIAGSYSMKAKSIGASIIKRIEKRRNNKAD